MTNNVSTIFVLQMGGLGDLVLLGDLIGSLKKAWPQATISLGCRAGLESVPGLYPIEPDEVVGVAFDLRRWTAPSDELLAAAEPVIHMLEGRCPDLYIAAALQPTWFSWFVGALLRPKLAVASTPVPRPRGLLRYVLESFRLPALDLTGPAFQEGMHERSRYAEILRFLGVPSISTPWKLPEKVRQAADSRLALLGLTPGQYLVCFPFGAASAIAKRWPVDRFVQVLRRLGQEDSLPLLLTGDPGEATELQSLARLLPEEGQPAALFADGSPGLPLLAGLMASARAYVGNDTGPMHLAAAYSVPGVAIYGGGYWPSYAPWGRGSVGIVHPLPCFQCNWDCLFQHPLCIESIPEETVLREVRRVLQNPPQAAEVVAVETCSAETLRLVADANRTYRQAQKDRADQFNTILEWQHRAEPHRARGPAETAPKLGHLPSVSVIVLSRNQAVLLPRALESVLRQSYPKLECIVVDTGSTDGSLEVLKSYQGRVRCLSLPAASRSAALNRGLAMASGDVVCWINAADLLLAGAVRTAATALAEDGRLTMVCGKGFVLDDDGNVQSRFPAPGPFDLKRLIQSRALVFHQSVFVRKLAVEQVAFLDESLQWGADWDLFLRLGKRLPAKRLPEYLSCIQAAPGGVPSGPRRLLDLIRILRRRLGTKKALARRPRNEIES